jgi:hypothetical protein
MDPTQKAVEVALDAIEELERPSLAWGFVDAFLVEDDVLDAVRAAFEVLQVEASAEETLERLEDQKVVRTWYEDGERRYRSRLAEFVRLATQSRQLFPNRPWRSAPTLVSDYRIDISPRRYPKRDTDPAQAARELAESGKVLSPIETRAWTAFFDGGAVGKLSRFQADALKRILEDRPGLATIITAGTGSGKTLAFYFPALIGILEKIRIGESFTKIVSLYPRNELLKDQFTEVFKLVRLLSPILTDENRRQITIGAFYGQVPALANEQRLKWANWKPRGDGYICPFLRCPNCGGETVWSRSDLQSGLERLRCDDQECGFVSDAGQILLTRASQQRHPPDLLFTTTETLNRRISDTWSRGVFGVSVSTKTKPSYVLLDEVHTYSGTSGAQSALLLRRWGSLIGSGVHWVGLSATLEEAPLFFGDLVGVPLPVEITPSPDDMEEEGSEYQVLLRGDPTSQAATLSTSIQTLMLLARMLDPQEFSPSSGFFGSRVFAFTDQLDVVNRLFDDLKDAEAYTAYNKEDPNKLPLAQLRSSEQPDQDDREWLGQRWAIAEDLRGDLSRRLVISRTSSRDPGVLQGSDVVVATSSLEVGFNDPDVGAVLQHKAPRSAASFIQRKGRAGRVRGMRPLMVTVLSDYGRDRLAFQSFERLFSPQVERQRLPVRNGYVLRMQATFAFLDWISDRAGRVGARGWAWELLAQPAKKGDAAHFRRFREATEPIVAGLVRLDAKWVNDLGRYLKRALDIDETTLRQVLWDPPRSLLLEALPTLARRLFTNWEMAADPKELDLNAKWHPLPDFIPQALFAELNLPEVEMVVPPARHGGEERSENIGIIKALSEFSPGRVRRSLADDRGGLSHWYPVNPDEENQHIPIDDFAPRKEFLGTFGGVRVFRPWSIKLGATPKSVSASSTSRWIWQSEFEFSGAGTPMEFPEKSIWHRYFSNAEFYLHRLAGAVGVRRFASSGVATLRVKRESRRIAFDLTDSGDEVGVGFAYEADGLRIALNPPSPSELASLSIPPEAKRWLKTLQFREAIVSSALLPATLNEFRRDWLFQVLIFAAVEVAESREISLSEAFSVVGTQFESQDFVGPIAAIVAATIIDDMPEEETRLERGLQEDLSNPEVVALIGEIGVNTFSEEAADWGEWLHKVFCNTLAEALLQACIISVPKNTATEGLSVDLVPNGEKLSAIIVESTLGGGGTIDSLAEQFSAEPNRFSQALEAALAPSDSETNARAMAQVLKVVCENKDHADSISKLRAASNPEQRERARRSFVGLLTSAGIQFSRSMAVGFGMRFVRPGVSTVTDELTRDLLQHWDHMEAQQKIVLPVRIAAALCAVDQDLREKLSSIRGVGHEISAAEQLLWPRGGELRQFGLQSRNPYRDDLVSDAFLLRATVLRDQAIRLSVDEERWAEKAEQVLVENGVVEISCKNSDLNLLRSSLLILISGPVFVNYHAYYPFIGGHREAENGDVVIVVMIREQI